MVNSFDPLMRISNAGVSAIAETRSYIRHWIELPVFQSLIRSFNWQDMTEASLNERIDRLVDMSAEWDFRRRTAKTESMGTSNEATRWTSHGELLTEVQTQAAKLAADELGLSKSSFPNCKSYQSALILGGARLSCLLRTTWGAQVLEDGVSVENIVMLGSERPISDSERDATNTYAPDARTEFDLFVDAGREVFQYDKSSYEGERHDDESPNLSWEVRRYPWKKQNQVLIISAPSDDPQNRRANSADTYKFYIEKEHLSAGDRLLLVSSPIYVPYQQLEAIRVITIPLGIHVETIGFPPDWRAELQGMQGAQHYLQEMRSFLQSSQRFLSAYPD
jgi:hypothetical protein